jgi:serine/threonine-protein kinase RIO1
MEMNRLPLARTVVRRMALPTPDRTEFRMLEALVADAVECAISTGKCAERFHGWEICVAVSHDSRPARAVLTIRHHGVLWQSASWMLDGPAVVH